MAKPQKRDSQYFLGRIKVEHPAIYADYLAGTYRSVAAASRAAGIARARTNVQVLKNAWGKASRNDKHEFLQWLKKAAAPSLAPVLPVLPGPIATNRKLEGWAKDRIKVILAAQRLTSNQLAASFGRSRFDASIGNALTCGWKLAPSTLVYLEAWLVANIAVT